MKGLVFLLILAAALPAQTPPVQQPLSQDAGVAAAQAWIGRALILRGTYMGSELAFDAAGHVKGSPKTNDWTLAGMDLDNVTRRATGELELEGVRVFIGYNQGGHVFERHPQKDDKLRILLPGATTPAAVDAELAAVFSQGIDPALERSLPPYWSHYFLPQLPWDDNLKGVTIYGANGKVPGEIVMPIPEKKAEPDTTTAASNAHVKGTIQASLVADSTGAPRQIVLRTPLGWGLDAHVAEALEHYRFKPGVLSGAPVNVQVIVNQTFE